jgi:hypothetical protein
MRVTLAGEERRMRGRLVEVGWEELAPAAVCVGAFATLLFGLANVDPAAAELRGALLGLIGLAVAVMGSTLEVTASPGEASQEGKTHWYEYDGSFRGL